MAKQSYQKIGNDFELSWQSVRKHAINHIQPLIIEANAQAQGNIVRKLTKYRAEVNFSALDKLKFLQVAILNELDSATEMRERIPLFRELRIAITEEAKLCGLYKNIDENSKRLEKVARAFKFWLEDHPEATAEEQAKFVERFAQGGEVPLNDLAQRVSVDITQIYKTQ